MFVVFSIEVLILQNVEQNKIKDNKTHLKYKTL